MPKRSQIFSARKLTSFITLLVFSTFSILPAPAMAQGILNLPAPGTMIGPSPAFTPVLIKGLIIDPQKPLVFDFIVEGGTKPYTEDQIKVESERLMKYFLASLTIPEEDIWVNLSPLEADRMVGESLGQTDMGRDLLAQDYILKQLTASLIYPENDLGKDFWSRVYQKAHERFGTTQIPVNTFNKVWITADRARIYEHENTAYVLNAHLKVMLEEDYMALEKNVLSEAGSLQEKDKDRDVNNISAQIVREVIIPEIEREVNEGKNFAPLRQIFYSIILAKWYKESIKNSLFAELYVNKGKVKGVDLDDPKIKEEIYQQYIAAYKEGVFNFIKEDVDPTQGLIPRKYFAGGVQPITAQFRIERETEETLANAAELFSGSRENTFRVRGAARPNAILDRERSAGKASRTVESSTQFLNQLQVAQTGKEEFVAGVAFQLSQQTGKKLKLNAEGELVQGLTYDVRGNEVEINFLDGSKLSYRTDATAKATEITMTTPEADVSDRDRSAVELTERILNDLIYNEIRFADFGYDHRITLRQVLDTIQTHEQAGRILDTASYDAEVAAARQFINERFGRDVGAMPVKMIETGEETFGIAVITNEDGSKALYVEAAFLSRMINQGNRFNAVQRAFVYALTEGTHEQKRFAEAEYALAAIPDLREQIDYDFVAEYQFNREQIFSGDIDEAMANDTARRVQMSIWEVAVHVMNRDIQEVYVRWNDDDPAYDANNPTHTRDANVSWYAFAANPGHYGQIETAFRTMASQKVAQIGWRVHAYDDRKEITYPTNAYRQGMVETDITKFSKFFRYSNLGRKSALDGETQLDVLMEINRGRPGRLRMGYIVGTDHMHWEAPDKKTDANGVRMPVMVGTTPRADTVKKFFNKRRDKASEYAQYNQEVVVYFNERDPKDGIPGNYLREDGTYVSEAEMLKQLEAEGLFVLLRGRNIQGVSSTAIRNALAGIGDPKALTVLPKIWNDFIFAKENGQYRGFIIELPQSIRRIAAGEGTPNDFAVFQNWLEVERGHGNDVSAERLAQLFHIDEQTIVNIIGPEEMGKLLTKPKVSPVTAEMAQRALQRLSEITIDRPTEEDRNVKINHGTSGWRAKLGATVNEGNFNLSNVGRYAQSVANKIKGNIKRRGALIAFDAREGGDQFAQRFVEVLRANGIPVSIGQELTTTPSVIAMTKESLGDEGFDIAFHITASHNDTTWQGIKVFQNGVVAEDDFTNGVIAAEARKVTTVIRQEYTAGEVPQVDIVKETIARYDREFGAVGENLRQYLANNPGVTVTLDVMHGSFSPFAPYFEAMGVKVVRTTPMKERTYPQGQVFNEDGRMVGYRPEPKRIFLSQEDFNDFEANAPVGSMYMAIDGDSDRLAIWVKVSATEIRELDPNSLGIAYGWDMIKSENTEGRRVIAMTQPTTFGMKALARWANTLGQGEYKVVVTPVGSKHFGPYAVDSIEDPADKILIGTEESGHQVKKEFFDDAGSQALSVLDMVTRYNKTMVELLDQAKQEIGFSGFYKRVNPEATPEIKGRITEPLLNNPRSLADRIATALGKTIATVYMTSAKSQTVTLEELEAAGSPIKENEGIKIEFTDGSWVQIRLSGTEPVARLYTEASSEADRQNIQDTVMRLIFNAQPTVEEEPVLPAEEETPVRPQTPIRDQGAASLSTERAQPLGGIDLNAANIQFEVERDGLGVIFNFNAQELQHIQMQGFEGFSPVILNVTPAPFIAPILGLETSGEEAIQLSQS